MSAMRWLVALMMLGWVPLLGCVVSAVEDESNVLLGRIHTIVSVECSAYFSFQILALAFSHKQVGQIGPITRIMACSDERLQKFTQEDMDMMKTHVTPQYNVDKETGDDYSPYNRPGGILHWLDNAKPREEWFFMVDPDIVFRRSISLEELYVKEGWIRASNYGYLVGTHNEFPLRHIPEVEPRKDKHGGPIGRRADEAGSFFYMRTRDMEKIAPLWMNYTKAVRADPEAWHLTGDEYAKKGEPVWISEMYGWAFAAAKADVWHILDPALQAYAENEVRASPALIHYGLEHKVEKYVFDKHHHIEFNYTKCPPWNMNHDRKKEEDAGLMPHPPFPHQVSETDPNKRYGLLMVIEFVTTINQALCERHHRMCSVSQQLTQECEHADSIRAALDTEYEVLNKQICRDTYPATCDVNVRNGDCEKDLLYMGWHCRQSCKWCPDVAEKGGNISTQSGARKGIIRAQLENKYLELRCRKLTVEELLDEMECMEWAEQYGIQLVHVQRSTLGFSPGFLFVVFVFLLFVFIASRLRKRKERGRKL